MKTRHSGDKWFLFWMQPIEKNSSGSDGRILPFKFKSDYHSTFNKRKKNNTLFHPSEFNVMHIMFPAATVNVLSMEKFVEHCSMSIEHDSY